MLYILFGLNNENWNFAENKPLCIEIYANLLSAILISAVEPFSWIICKQANFSYKDDYWRKISISWHVANVKGAFISYLKYKSVTIEFLERKYRTRKGFKIFTVNENYHFLLHGCLLKYLNKLRKIVYKARKNCWACFFSSFDEIPEAL